MVGPRAHQLVADQSGFDFRQTTDGECPRGHLWCAGRAASRTWRCNPKTGATIAGSTTAWFLFAGPVDLPFIFASTGAGEGPTIQQFGIDADPNRLTISFRAHADFVAAVGDYHASVYSTGA